MNHKTRSIREYMTKAPHTIEGNSSLKLAQEIMQEHKVRHLPVVAKGKVVGVLSERTLKMALGLKGAQAYTVAEVMTENPYSVEPHTALDEAVSIMAEEKCGSVIVEEGGKLVGIFTTTDACRVLYEYLAKEVLA